jgi:hypothetical protein
MIDVEFVEHQAGSPGFLIVAGDAVLIQECAILCEQRKRKVTKKAQEKNAGQTGAKREPDRAKQ